MFAHHEHLYAELHPHPYIVSQLHYAVGKPTRLPEQTNRITCTISERSLPSTLASQKMDFKVSPKDRGPSRGQRPELSAFKHQGLYVEF